MSWLAVLLYTLLIFFLSSQQYTDYFRNLEDRSYWLFEHYLQYPTHATEYAVLAVLWLRALRQPRMARANLAKFTLVAVVLTALVDESIQYFVPTRSFAVQDLCMDTLGGMFIVLLLNGKAKGRGQTESRDRDRSTSPYSS